MENKTTIRIWEHSRVQEVLPTLSLASREAYKDFSDKLSQGYYPIGQEKLPNSPGCISFILPTGDRVIYRVDDSVVTIDRIDTSAFLWKLSAKLNSTLDQIGRLITLQQIFSMLVSFLGTKLF